MPEAEISHQEDSTKQPDEFSDIFAQEMKRAAVLEARLSEIAGSYIDRSELDPTDLIAVYFKEVGAISLLTAEDEVALAKDIELSLEASEILANDIDLPESERLALEAVRNSGKLASDHLILANRRLVISVAKIYQGHGVPLPDLIQEGTLGLMRAVKKYDYRLGYKFSTYATWWIRQGVSRCLGGQGRDRVIPVHTADLIRRIYATRSMLTVKLGRLPLIEEIADTLEVPIRKVAFAYDVSRRDTSLNVKIGDGESELGDFLHSAATTPDELAEAVLRDKQIEELLLALPPRHARVIEYRYGIGREHLLLKEIGYRFGVTHERIRQLEKEALASLRRPDRAARLIDYLE